MAALLTQRVLSTTHTIGKASKRPIVRTYLCLGVSDEHTLQTPWPNDGALCASPLATNPGRLPSYKLTLIHWQVPLHARYQCRGEACTHAHLCVSFTSAKEPCRDTSDAKYGTYKDYYERRWSQIGLRETSPLLLGRAFTHAATSTNYLSPDANRTALHDHAAEVEVLQRARGDATEHADGAAAAALRERWRGDGQGLKWPLLPPELCYVHWLPLHTVREVQYLPSLLFRLEVRLLSEASHGRKVAHARRQAAPH